MLTKELLLRSVDEWNEARQTNLDNTIDLVGAHLHGAFLSGANLSGLNLFKADFSGANLNSANLADADLRWVNFTEANLSSADLNGSVLDGANLSKANLNGADFSWATLCGVILDNADLNNSTLRFTVFADVDLSEAIGLENIQHWGPATIGIDTLHRSKGTIPKKFLRGCGVPDNFIDYVHSFTGKAIDYYSCFISHSSKDKVFVDKLYANLQAKEVLCWYAPENLKSGDYLHDQIDRAIRGHEKLLLILSDNSMESEWVKTEIKKAKKQEDKEGKRVLFPISLVEYEKIAVWEFFDSDTGRDLAEEIRKFYIPSFEGWEKNDEAYTKEFNKLLESFKTADDNGPP